MKKCKSCDQPFEPTHNTTQKVCNWKCAIALNKINKAKNFNKETKRRKKELRSNDLSHQKKLRQTVVNRLVLLRDSDKECISCQTRNDVQYAAGHYKTTGAHPELRFNLNNINKQCNKYCNSSLSGNIKGQIAGITQRHGLDHLIYLDGAHERIKYTCEDLIKFRKEINVIIREMESGKPFREPSMYQEN